MTDVFLSYARQEDSRAKQIADALQQRGFSVWVDRQIIAGDSWANLIEEQLHEASCVVVLWSKDSVVNTWVNDEAAYARELSKLVPVLIDNVQAPLGFRALQSIVLSDWTGESDHPAFQQLVDAVSERAAR